MKPSQKFLSVRLMQMLLAAVLLGFSVPMVHAEVELVWGSDLTNALQNAKASHHPVLLEFSAPWCPYCKQMEGKTFKDSSVVSTLENFERVAVNIDHNASLAAQHAVRGIPAFVLLDAEGDEVAKTSGFMEADAFTKWLSDSVTNLTATAAQKEEFLTGSRDIAVSIASTDAAIREKGIAKALEWSARKEKGMRDYGLAKLEAVAKTDPALLLDGLKHPDLAIRIRIANLLRDKLGDGFNIDPWEKAEARDAAIRVWQTKLAAKNGR